jgi:cytochrome bd-type quinol oxidase subunit 2
MATATMAPTAAPAARRLARGATVMAVAGIGFIGYGLLFFVQNFTGFLELGISHAEVDVGRAEIQRFSPSLYHYLSHLHIALAGFIAACGVAVAALAWFGVRRGQLWAWVTAVAVPVLALAVALPAHYPYNLDTVGHLGLIYADTALFVVGAVLALAGMRARHAIH